MVHFSHGDYASPQPHGTPGRTLRASPMAFLAMVPGILAATSFTMT